MKRIKKILATSFALALFIAVFAACAKQSAPVSATASTVPTSAEPQTKEQPKTVKDVILVVSFGTSYDDNRELSVGGVENAIKKAYPDYDVRRAFTSQIIIDKLKRRDNIEIDNVKQAMDRLVSDGVKNVIVQPTHVMEGYEYDGIVSDVTPYKDKFGILKIGKNLISSDADFDAVIKAVTDETKPYNKYGTAVVLMGHGTEHPSNSVYAKLQEKLTASGFKNYFVGTVEAEPSLEDVIKDCKNAGVKKVVLLPLMIVAGDHANNDMAGDEEDSWKSQFKKAGFDVECELKGLGQYPAIQELIVKHLGETIAEK